jgi:hypothetical protein
VNSGQVIRISNSRSGRGLGNVSIGAVLDIAKILAFRAGKGRFRAAFR